MPNSRGERTQKRAAQRTELKAGAQLAARLGRDSQTLINLEKLEKQNKKMGKGKHNGK